MYADDLALVSSSPEELQSMINIVATYAEKWQYQLNADKSSILVLGESAIKLGKRKSVKLMSSTTWESCVLCSPPPSIRPQRDASQQEALNSIGSRSGCLHPLTLAVPNLVHPNLYGAEI